MRQLLTETQARFLREEKEALADVRTALAGLDVARDVLTTLQNAILQLDELFLLVVVGEFNAGKSALMNALLGAGQERVLAEGVTPTTSRVTLVKWGPEISEQVVDEGYAIYTHPMALLRELNIVDTPGTNAVIRQHERLTEEFVPRSDLVLFVTSADRPMTESERQFLERIRAWGKKVIVAINKADIFENEAARQGVLSTYAAELKSELGPRLAEIENILVRLQERGLDFFDRTMRLTNIANLARGDRVRADFEKEVLADVPKQIEERVQRLIDWLVQKDLHQWQQIMTYLQRRQARHTEHLVGEAAAPLDARSRTLRG